MVDKIESGKLNKYLMLSAYVLLGVVVLFILLFVLFSKEDVPFEDLPPETREEIAKAEEQTVLDNSNYNFALSSNNSYYCQFIKSESLKSKCLDEITELIEPEIDTRSEQDVLDESNFNFAISSENSFYCEFIVDSSLRESCFASFG